ncbi:hypothetical protein RAB80_010228 [Fusarium oxysporum f. sp. vasinfectum]|nr:hypothetical protein RAB80_010228 [Fusarium oxysporum f. sp. vasinfectum]
MESWASSNSCTAYQKPPCCTASTAAVAFADIVEPTLITRHVCIYPYT